MSFVKIDGLDIYYEKSGKKPIKVVLLHGWGCDSKLMAFIGEHLKSHFTVYNIDLPGFGQSSEPPTTWGADDYTDLVHKFCKKNKIDNPIIIAHSFGCRIAIRYAYRYGAYKMCLTGAAGLRKKRDLNWYIKTYSYKIAKRVLSLKPFIKYKEKLLKNAGSVDYQNASGVMRSTLVKVVNEDCSDLLPGVKAEILLVFGENDTSTPVYMGKIMEEKMPNASLVVFEGDDHFAYIHQAERFCRVLDAFLGADYD